MSVIVKDSIGQDVKAGDTVVYKGRLGLTAAKVSEIHVYSRPNGDHEIVWVSPIVPDNSTWRDRAARCVGDFVKVAFAGQVETAQ